MLDKIGQELFKKDWKPKSTKKSYLVETLHTAFADPKKAANGSMDVQQRIETWLPAGMAFNGLLDDAKKKVA